MHSVAAEDTNVFIHIILKLAIRYNISKINRFRDYYFLLFTEGCRRTDRTSLYAVFVASLLVGLFQNSAFTVFDQRVCLCVLLC